MKKVKEAKIEEKNDIEKISEKEIENKESENQIENIEKKEHLEEINKIKPHKFHCNFPRCTNNILLVVITIVICSVLFVLFYKFFLSKNIIEKTKLVKDVTVTDTGIADAVEKVYDSVVVVKTYSREQLYSTGTGFVFKTDDKYGYILTNYHVISNSSNVEVVFTNNETIEAKIVGSDEYADIAILSVEKDNIISTAITGSSEDMRVGDTTFAVGAPIDSTVYSWSVTRGILSGKNRLVESDDNYIMEVLQTDTAINSGNSGGPLCNSNGEVIGITNMKLASSSIEGMGFAIPIETALEYADSIMNGTEIRRPYIGVSIYDAKSYFSSTTAGIYVESVESNSPADKAGLKKGDKITKVNDKEVSNVSYFKYELYKYDIGDKVKITIERDGKEKEITITLGSNSMKS